MKRNLKESPKVLGLDISTKTIGWALFEIKSGSLLELTHVSPVPKPKEECKIYSDSLYVINCAIGKWKRKANQDLWEEYEKVSLNKKVEFEWIKGHSGNEYNEKVDKMALSEARSIDI